MLLLIVYYRRPHTYIFQIMYVRMCRLKNLEYTCVLANTYLESIYYVVDRKCFINKYCGGDYFTNQTKPYYEHETSVNCVKNPKL